MNAKPPGRGSEKYFLANSDKLNIRDRFVLIVGKEVTLRCEASIRGPIVPAVQVDDVPGCLPFI
jgi:hypothetical protein